MSCRLAQERMTLSDLEEEEEEEFICQLTSSASRAVSAIAELLAVRALDM